MDSSSAELKECRKCKKLFPPELFRKTRKICKSCGNAEWNASFKRCGNGWPSKSREKVNAYNRARRANPEINDRIKVYTARYKSKNRISFLVRSARNRARKAGIECDEVFLMELGSPSHCKCCGMELDYSLGTRTGNRPKNLCPSLDRIDVRFGYVRGNVAVICWRCNALKRDGNLDEFENIVSYIKENSPCEGNGQQPS